MIVTLSKDLENKAVYFPKSDRIKIAKFIKHVENYGLTNLTGRNKSSAEVPTNGEQVSEYILHYQRFDDEIRLVAMSYHPPFELPSEDYLT